MNTPQLVGPKRANASQGMGLGVSIGARICMGTILFILMSLWTNQHALAQNPKVDLLVELRQIEEGSTGVGNTTWGTLQREQLLTPQRIQVRNGSKASMSLGQSVPVQWVQSVGGFTSSQSFTGGDTSTTVGTTTNTAKGGSAQGSSKGGSVTNGLMMMDTGQRLVVHPTWGGGTQAVVVEVEVQSARLDTRPGADLPSQSRNELVTTVSAPVGHWVTIASTGASAVRGSYGSEGAETSRKLLQLRISTP
ncbi:MAG: hypothetical protein EB072_09400 [Betaproteobacteria bacterium]|nr:hypothetical protein [Betaproteobacteria bacterium]